MAGVKRPSLAAIPNRSLSLRTVSSAKANGDRGARLLAGARILAQTGFEYPPTSISSRDRRYREPAPAGWWEFDGRHMSAITRGRAGRNGTCAVGIDTGVYEMNRPRGTTGPRSVASHLRRDRGV